MYTATRCDTPPPHPTPRRSADAVSSTRALVDVLSRDADPKMRNSKFLQFVSKMSRGELLFEDNKVRTVAGRLGATSPVIKLVESVTPRV